MQNRLPICFLFQVLDDKGKILPPGTQGDLGIRVKPIRPIGIFSGYVVRNPLLPSVLCGDSGDSERDGGGQSYIHAKR